MLAQNHRHLELWEVLLQELRPIIKLVVADRRNVVLKASASS